jgi:hypothetical protein
MQGYCQQEGIAFGRLRPFRNNDHTHIEQRNWSILPVALKRDCDYLLERLGERHMVRFLADAPGPSK